jgi:hypothetical protein
MGDEEHSSVFGGLGEMISAGADAVYEAGATAAYGLATVGGTVVTGAESIAAGAAYTVGSYDTASELDQLRQDAAQDTRDLASQTAEHAENVGEDIWG